ncbi:MAG: terpene cyclase/mutase family protein [Planctomycetota bacterium]|nr:terpene cyclase/mutase family protein [Planctomycetota bacterium]
MRIIVRVLLMLAVCMVLPAAGDDEAVLAALAADQPRDRAITRGLAYIRSQQDERGAVGDKHTTALTAMAIMAHLAAGHPVYDAEHGAWMQRSLSFVLDRQRESGYFGEKDGSRMYGHGIVTLMLAESLGMIGDRVLEERVRSALTRAVAVTVNAAQVKKSDQHRGGWRYHPGDNNSDLSLSGWQLMSLHAAQQVGIAVPEEVIANAVDYAKRLTTDDGKVGYQKRGEDKSALRGLGALCFVVGGESDDDRVDRIVTRISKDPIRWKGPWFFYRVYYDAVGMSRARPEVWAMYRPQLEAAVLGNQHADGYWAAPPNDNESKHGRIYSTSMVVLALAVERYVLPAYQR